MSKFNVSTTEIKTNIEDFWEKHNAKLQIAICVVSLIIGAYFNVSQDNQLGVIIGLLVLISCEILSLSIKDSISQRKLNNIGERFEEARGALVRVSDFNLSDIFNKTKGEFYISGIALNGFFQNNYSTISSFLEEGKKIDILITSPKAVRENTLLYYGFEDDEEKLIENMNAILNKQIATLDYIVKIPDFYKYLESNQFNLRTLSTAFTTSFVAHDIFERNVLGIKKKESKELKASFYQYKCIEPQREPNIVVDSFMSRDWYLFFKNTITMQWRDGNSITSKKEFEELHDSMNKMIQENLERKKK